MTSRALDVLRTSPEAAELAAYPFNVDLGRADHLEAVHLASGMPMAPWAGHDTGGTYFHCAGGGVLYASSDGAAGLIADSIDETLETLTGLPCWHDLLHHLPPDADDATLTAAVTEAEEEFAEYYGAGLDADRRRLLGLLGLREQAPAALVRRLHDALLRTEPDFLLLNSAEGLAHALLDGLPRRPLWESVLAPGRSDLAALRSDPGVLAAHSTPTRPGGPECCGPPGTTPGRTTSRPCETWRPPASARTRPFRPRPSPSRVCSRTACRPIRPTRIR
ncbi:hypothetical protein BX265_0932 [Streptomyces sp. TLI_235]|nr:hypothetical protein [Streptomyces sp. TLI_235]PBC76226.1 hypothetical protein BX265_0932 [Streptomyces sp. TLI_235]